MGWPEDVARELRAASGGDLEALALILGDAVTAVPAPARSGLCVYRPGGRFILLVPRRRAAAVHEFAHAALHTGYGDTLRRQGARCWQRQVWKEEAQAERFAAAFEDD